MANLQKVDRNLVKSVKITVQVIQSKTLQMPLIEETCQNSL